MARYVPGQLYRYISHLDKDQSPVYEEVEIKTVSDRSIYLANGVTITFEPINEEFKP